MYNLSNSQWLLLHTSGDVCLYIYFNLWEAQFSLWITYILLGLITPI